MMQGDRTLSLLPLLSSLKPSRPPRVAFTSSTTASVIRGLFVYGFFVKPVGFQRLPFLNSLKPSVSSSLLR
uniref:Uncharacterized protein n=1 Tax=Nelumbo nucifera TaxID=4432 RepID=A0A822XS99_NELNU|nr:TPA_asm: hypothetical protein HUJ06_023422 [Nelumbo nucifera]